ncbi:RNA polymerase sigma factor [bacterium]|nr:RNA polymerase sigma factor [bacterium]
MEAKLIKLLKTGDSTAFKQFVEANQDRVVSICYGFLKNKRDAEDTAQEVFIEVYRSIGKFRGDSKLSTWLYRIAVTKSLDFLRKKKRRGKFHQLTTIFYEHNSDNIAEPADASRPDFDLMENERREILNRAINKLSDDQKTSIVLNKLQGYSYKEVAEIMNKSVSSVESLIYRSTKNLKGILSHLYEKKLL